ncbi:MAG TPA: phospholipase D-like domain-containing protein [Thermomicrobiales bacterium]
MAARRRTTSRRTRRSARPLTLRGALLLFVVLLIIYAVEEFRETSDQTLPPASPGSGTVGVFVEPDDGREPILDELNAATSSIRLAVYLLSDREIIDALKQAHNRGVDVRVLLEDAPFGGPGNQPEIYAELERAGIAVRWSDPRYRFTHIKTFIIDERVAIIMNLNLTRSSFTRNREFAAITTREEEVKQALAIFDADWNRAEDPPDGPLVVSPGSSREEIEALLASATESLDIYAEVVRDSRIVSLLSAAEDRGVDVRIILPPDDDENDREILFGLMDDGVEVRTVPGLYIHAKLIIVDGEKAFVGSQNFTATSLDLNRELGIILTDPVNVGRLISVFESDFRAGEPFV